MLQTEHLVSCQPLGGDWAMQCPITGNDSLLPVEYFPDVIPDFRTTSKYSETPAFWLVKAAISYSVQLSFSDRVLEKLSAAQAKEPDFWLAEDYHIAWLTVLLASEGCPDPWVIAFASYFGKHPVHLVGKIRDQEWIWWRLNACQGPEPSGLPEKKSVKSVRQLRKEQSDAS